MNINLINLSANNYLNKNIYIQQIFTDKGHNILCQKKKSLGEKERTVSIRCLCSQCFWQKNNHQWRRISVPMLPMLDRQREHFQLDNGKAHRAHLTTEHLQDISTLLSIFGTSSTVVCSSITKGLKLFHLCPMQCMNNGLEFHVPEYVPSDWNSCWTPRNPSALLWRFWEMNPAP